MGASSLLSLLVGIALFAVLASACSPVLSCGDMQALAKKHFPSNYVTDMICIAYYESSWCPKAYNGICCYGLWQINSNHLGEPGCPKTTGELLDPDTNAACARHVLDSQGLDAWTTWTSGDCRGWNKCNGLLANGTNSEV